nr:MAG: putative RNA-dependent RNA polymerase [Mitoviridae sp.]
MERKNKMLRIIEQLVSKILALYFQSNGYSPVIEYYFARLDSLIAERGLAFTVMYVKTSRNCVMRCITGRPLKTCEGVSLEGGWPYWLLPLKHLTSDQDGIRVLMTMLISLRGVILPPVLDLSPIISPWLGSLPVITVKQHKHVCRGLGIRPKLVEWTKPHMSTKRGPLGQALLTSVTELTLLPQELLDSIFLVGGPKLKLIIEALRRPIVGTNLSVVDIWSKLYPAKTKSLRRISYFSDKEGKTRVIAILDYWSQTALRPLHDALNAILKKIPQDCTFNQNHFLKCLPPKGPYYSIDLSNATDRMPVSLQKTVIREVIGEARTDAWAHILTGYEYTLQGMARVAKYACGQPMGAYSSWCAMALTHHYLVRVAALKAGIPHFRDYALLGDDLVIASAAVATEYRNLLSILDMPVSEAKTHVSDDTYEFAKRWVHKGEEITGFAVSGLRAVWKKYSLLHNYLQTQQHHGWCLLSDKHPDLVRTIYNIYGRPTHVVRVIKLYMVFDSLQKCKVTGDYGPLLGVIAIYFPGHLSTSLVDGLTGLSTLQNTARRVVSEAKRRLIEKDLAKFQTDTWIIHKRLDEDVCREFRDLPGQAYRAALRDCHPLVMVLNRTIDLSIEYLCLHSMFDPSPEQDYTALSLAKYHVSKGVFSMRASHSITLAQSMVVKSILDVLKSEDISKQNWATTPLLGK